MLEGPLADLLTYSVKLLDLIFSIWVDLDDPQQLTTAGSDFTRAIAEVSVWIVDIAARISLNITT